MVQTPQDFRAGDFVEIKQENDPAIMYTRPEWDQSWAENAVGQICRVESVRDDGTLTLNRPLHFTYRSALHPQIRTLGMITYPGAEDFYIERLDAGDGNSIQMRYVAFGRLARGADINDSSHGQNLLGNVVKKGSINITAGVTQTLMHGNVVNGKVAWDPTIENKKLPVSYFLTEKPSFLGNSPWPLFGPDATGDHKLPAQLRYESGNPILGR